MTSRERARVWWEETLHPKVRAQVGSGIVDHLAVAFDEARDAALEEAALVADAVGSASHQEAGQQDDKEEHEAWENWGNGAQDVAERIRALKETP